MGRPSMLRVLGGPQVKCMGSREVARSLVFRLATWSLSRGPLFCPLYTLFNPRAHAHVTTLRLGLRHKGFGVRGI